MHSGAGKAYLSVGSPTCVGLYDLLKAEMAWVEQGEYSAHSTAFDHVLRIPFPITSISRTDVSGKKNTNKSKGNNYIDSNHHEMQKTFLWLLM